MSIIFEDLNGLSSSIGLFSLFIKQIMDSPMQIKEFKAGILFE